MPTTENPQMEKILDERISKKTRRKNYFEYLVKWKDHQVKDASWVTEPKIQKHGKIVEELMDRSPWIFFPEEYDAGASQSTFKEAKWRTYRCPMQTFKVDFDPKKVTSS